MNGIKTVDPPEKSKFVRWLNLFWPDLVIIFALTLLAVLIRIPKLMEIPLFTDEMLDVRAVYKMMLEKQIYLRSPVSPYTGPVLHYLLKGFMKAFGVNIFMPRILLLILGSLTVPVVYCWGRSLGNRVSGLVSGLLLSLNLPHIIINSHIAWSNSMTPFFVTLAFAIMYFSVKNDKGPLLILGGFLLGVGLQTHASVLVLFPGVLIWYLARRDIGERLRKPWPYLTFLAVLVGYGNMIAYNVMTRLGSLKYIQKQDYAFVTNHTASLYFSSLLSELGELSKAVSGVMLRKVFPTGLSLVMIVLYVLWLLAGLVITIKKRQLMPVILLLASILVMPYFNKAYPGGLTIHYITFMLPISFVIMGLAISGYIDLFRWFKDRKLTPLILTVVFTILFFVYPLFQIPTYYNNEIKDGATNGPIIKIVEELRKARDLGEEIFLEEDLKKFSMAAGNQLLWTFESLFLLDGTRYRMISEGMIVKLALEREGTRTWFILTKNDFDKASRLVPLEEIIVNPGPNNYSYYGLFKHE